MIVAKSCPTLCNPMDYSLSGSSVLGILQARLLEWVSISFSILSFYFQFVGSIHLERVLNLSNVFSASIEMMCILNSANVEYYIT